MLIQRNKIEENLERISFFSEKTKLFRFFRFPIKRFFCLFTQIYFAIFNKGINVISETFFGEKISILLPLGMDIFILGGRSNESEIRFSKFLLKNLNNGDVFFDIGAHYGLYSLFSSVLVGERGRVFSFEPSSMFSFLKKNVLNYQNVEIFNLAISSKDGKSPFREFGLLDSESDGLLLSSGVGENLIEVETISLDSFYKKNNIVPSIIKIDVEGAENEVIIGGGTLFAEKDPIIIMEIWDGVHLKNEAHLKAVERLVKSGYIPYLINSDGDLVRSDDVTMYCRKNKNTFDNIVFKK